MQRRPECSPPFFLVKVHFSYFWKLTNCLFVHELGLKGFVVEVSVSCVRGKKRFLRCFLGRTNTWNILKILKLILILSCLNCLNILSVSNETNFHPQGD
jgi:hypothetical protein